MTKIAKIAAVASLVIASASASIAGNPVYTGPATDVAGPVEDERNSLLPLLLLLGVVGLTAIGGHSDSSPE